MTDSVLDSTKKILGFDAEYKAFDLDIITHINMAFSILHQLGVGPTIPFVISDSSDNWSSFTGENKAVESVKSYVWAKVRLMFDPPSTSFGIAALEKLCTELEWRLNVQSDEVIL